MWDLLPEPLRKLFGQPVNRYKPPVQYASEWPLYMAATLSLGLDMETAYRLMDAGPLPPRFRYRHFTVAKKDGSQREIVQPGPDLMAVQRLILKLVLNKI